MHTDTADRRGPPQRYGVLAVHYTPHVYMPDAWAIIDTEALAALPDALDREHVVAFTFSHEKARELAGRLNYQEWTATPPGWGLDKPWASYSRDITPPSQPDE